MGCGWHLGSRGAVPGLAGQGEPRLAPLCSGGTGGASLGSGYRGSQDIELSRDVCLIHGERWEKLTLRICSHRDLLEAVGTAGEKLPTAQEFFGVALEVQHPSALGKGSYRPKLSLLRE